MPVLCALALVYFGYHSIHGERGLLAWTQRSQEVVDARTRVAALAAEHARLGHRVSRLRPESLDLDLLDERARAILNLAEPDEIILFTPRDGD